MRDACSAKFRKRENCVRNFLSRPEGRRTSHESYPVVLYIKIKNPMVYSNRIPSLHRVCCTSEDDFFSLSQGTDRQSSIGQRKKQRKKGKKRAPLCLYGIRSLKEIRCFFFSFFYRGRYIYSILLYFLLILILFLFHSLMEV